MAEEIKKVITVDTGQSTQTVKGLKQEISGLKDALLNTSKGGEEWESIVSEIIKKQEQLNDVTRISKQTTDAAADSIVGMEKQYKALYDTYKLLSEEQRNSDFGKNMAQSLEQLSSKLNETKQGVGNFKDNIGHYSQSIMDAFSKMGVSVGALQGPMKAATLASNGLGKSLKALVANPVGAVIMAIVVAFKALEAIVNRVKEAINSNEESQMALKEAMSAFQPIIDGVKNAFDSLGQMVVKVVGFIGEAVRKIREAAAAVTDFLGITQGAKERIEQQNESYRELAQAQNELIKNKREYQKLNATDKAEVERLREEAEATTDKTEKLKLLNEAKNIQSQIDERNLALAEENLRILQLEAEKTANDAAANERLAQAEAAVEEARAALNKNARTYTRQINTVTKAVKSGKSAAEEYAEKIKKMKEEVANMEETIRKSHLTEIQKLEEEKKAWIEKYKAIGKATDEVEKYYDAQIKAANQNKEIAAGKETTDLIKTYVKNDDSAQRVGVGSDMFDIVYDYLESSKSDTEKKKLTLELELFFKDVVKNAKEQVKDNFNFTYEDLIPLGTEDVKRIEQEYNGMISSILGNVDFFGGPQDGESYEKALERLIGEKQKEIADLVSEITEKGLPISTENQEKLQLLEYNINGLCNAYESLGKLILQNDEILESESVANFITNGLFGTGTGMQDKNGFALFDKLDTSITKLHKGLYNSSKVWQDYGQAVTTVCNAVANAWQKNINKQLESGEISQEEAEKQFKQMKAMQYALAGINMASGIIQCFADPSLVTWYAKAAAAAAVLATGTAEMITIANTEMGSSSAGSGASAISFPQMTDTNPYTYTRQVQTAEEEEKLNQPIYVSVTDIENVQNKVKVTDKESTF